MDFLVLMKLSEEGVGETVEENRNILEKLIIPSIEELEKMEKKNMVRGGFFEGQRSAAFIFSVSSGRNWTTYWPPFPSRPCSAWSRYLSRA